MIAPTSSELKISRRTSFEPKSASLNEPTRGLVVGLDICSESMQEVPTKRLGQYSEKAFLHIVTLVVRYECIVTEVTGAEHAAQNFVDVDYASEFPGFSADPVTKVCAGVRALKTGRELVISARSTSPNLCEAYGFEPPQPKTRPAVPTRVFARWDVPSWRMIGWGCPWN